MNTIPKKTRQLLQQAGYDPANEIDIFTRVTRIPKQVEVAEAYQAYLSQVESPLRLTLLSPGYFRSALLAALVIP